MTKNKEYDKTHKNTTNHILDDEQLQDISGGVEMQKYNKALLQWMKDDPGKKVTPETVNYLLSVIGNKSCTSKTKEWLLSYSSIIQKRN